MYDLFNGLNGGELNVDHHNDSLTSDSFYDDVVDFNYSTNNQFTGYQDGYFGNDPLSQSKIYQCPKFPGVTLVDSYVRADGTVVNAHWRTNPDGIISNNFSANK
ncbi:hypothetical protein D1B33_03505 [Lysinibacillus yapensis]|uniref:Uncharacterized protein n=2 Tax=Ureibacillus yapensis TaxID=2304605 RepID=A0A396SF60_9BACL|nr:hypothetical protein D1B33_03505 [Lysinibacillus yapensis]